MAPPSCFPLHAHRLTITVLRLLTLIVALFTLAVVFVSPKGRLVRASRDKVALVRPNDGMREWGGIKFQFDHKDGFLGYAEGGNILSEAKLPKVRTNDAKSSASAEGVAHLMGYLISSQLSALSYNESMNREKVQGVVKFIPIQPVPDQFSGGNERDTHRYPRVGIFGSGPEVSHKTCHWITIQHRNSESATIIIPKAMMTPDPWHNLITCPNPIGGTENTRNIEDMLPFLIENYGNEIDVPLHLHQYFSSIKMPKSYIESGVNERSAEYTLSDIRMVSSAMRFILSESFTNPFSMMPEINMGGSSFIVQLIMSTCSHVSDEYLKLHSISSNKNSNVLEVMAICDVSDNLNGIYEVFCPVEAAGLLVQSDLNGVLFKVNIELLHTHFRGFHGTEGYSEDPHNIQIFKDLVVGHQNGVTPEKNSPWWKDGLDQRKRCTKNDVAEGNFGGVWAKLNVETESESYQWKWIHNIECSLETLLKPTKATLPVSYLSRVNPTLAECIEDRPLTVFLGASHIRYQFDQVAQELGIRDGWMDQHHGSYSYLKDRLQYVDLRYYREAEVVMRYWNRPDGPLKNDTVAIFQAGAWNAAACESTINLIDMDSMFRQLHQLRHATNSTLVWVSTPPYPRNIRHEATLSLHRHMRKTPYLLVLEQLNELYIEAINRNARHAGRPGIAYVDFYSVASGRSEDSVCMDHYNCPVGMTMVGEVGMEVTNVILNAICLAG